MASEKVHFKANAGVKDIVGRGLIYDDNVAIIELVKNAKDAGSLESIIKFSKETEISESSLITICDSGKGMNLNDVEDKWLNIAYSEKKGNRLNAQSPYAGNKGVGRFSCDRLGSHLDLYTKAHDGDYLKLPINWELFEDKDKDDEISSISLECQVLEKNTFLNEIDDTKFNTGTVLKIRNLRSEWNSKKLKKLIAELEKFSPSLDSGFEVYIYSDTPHKDKELNKKLNQKIDNNILEKLSFKTTNIKSTIDEDGKKIVTSLYYQEEEVYRYTAINPYKYLKNISAEIHFLDTLSKSYFTRNIGVNPNTYGSVFLFYNGFRISPYGNEKNDWLGLDQRKSQGTARNLGTREVFGRIDINDLDDDFSVVSSREGLAHNNSFQDLVAFDKDEKTILSNGKESYGFVTTLIHQLENFVVSGLDWNRLIDRFAGEEDKKKIITIKKVLANPSQYALKSISSDKVKEACDRILKADWEIEDFKINDDLVLEITQKAEEKYKQFLDDFSEKVETKAIKDLSPSEKGTLKKIVEQEQEKTNAAKEERDYAEKKRDIAEQVIKTEKRRSNFLETLVSPEKNLDALVTHVIDQITGGIEKDIKSILAIYYKNPEKISKEELIEVLEEAVVDISTIKASASLASKADFNLKIPEMKGDIFGFIEDYIRQIVPNGVKWGININFTNSQNEAEIRSFKPADISSLIVNILDNSSKANAKNLWITCNKNKVTFTDDGVGFDFETYNKNDFLRKGISTTSTGSGLGLFHAQDIAKNLSAELTLNNDTKTKGAVITMEFK